MEYKSTRNFARRVSAAQAIAQGISEDGGLFVPAEIPALSQGDIRALCDMSYVERAESILLKYLTDFSLEEIQFCAQGAYGHGKFDDDIPAPLSRLGENAYMLELWHGPTCAFKDMALQILPYLLTVSAKKTIAGKEAVILVATSGDTGKAALEGFKDVPGTRIMVFYPQDGVSEMQRLQMTTQDGGNVFVCAVKGNFDDCQRGVKRIFTDKQTVGRLAENGMVFSSANSINWGRLLPQIVYYISAYCDLVREERITLGDPINVVVPTGNFGNILAAYYAKRMGLPIARFICASNANRILTDFIGTGVYDINRPFYTTLSPSMDILVSSNLERLLYHLSGDDAAYMAECMSALSSTGRYEIGAPLLRKLNDLFVGGCCDDEQTQQTIHSLFEEYGYVSDTHTAVAYKVYRDYVSRTKDDTVAIIVSTANAYKFPASVYAAVAGPAAQGESEFAVAQKLAKATHTEIPASLQGLEGRAVRFKECCDAQSMQETVLRHLGIR